MLPATSSRRPADIFLLPWRIEILPMAGCLLWDSPRQRIAKGKRTCEGDDVHLNNPERDTDARE